jgi:chromosome segregation ATPase
MVAHIKENSQAMAHQAENDERLGREAKAREKALKLKVRELERSLELSQEETAQVKMEIDAVNGEYKKMKEQMKEIDMLLRQERNKSTATIGEISSVRRQRLQEVEKMKADFEVIKKTEMDQVGATFFMEIDRKNDEIELLKHELLDKNDKLQQLTNRLKKYEEAPAPEPSKAVEFQKKLAAMGAEIGLTQSLYQAFVSTRQKLEE